MKKKYQQMINFQINEEKKTLKMRTKATRNKI